MANVIVRPQWLLPEARVTPEKCWRNRREFLRQLGRVGLGTLVAAAGAPLLASEVRARVDSRRNGTRISTPAGG